MIYSEKKNLQDVWLQSRQPLVSLQKGDGLQCRKKPAGCVAAVKTTTGKSADGKCPAVKPSGWVAKVKTPQAITSRAFFEHFASEAQVVLFFFPLFVLNLK